MDDDARPTRQQISDAVDPLGWRLMLGRHPNRSVGTVLERGAEAASLAVSAAGADGQGHLTVDIRADRAVLRLQSAEAGAVTGRDIRLAHRVSGALGARGLHTTPGDGSVQMLEIAIDALDIPAVRPFWKAITGYVDEPGLRSAGGLIDPAGRGPAIWFQQMDAPRPQRNRIHIDVDVPHDVARHEWMPRSRRAAVCCPIEAAPAFWVLADPEGNEACICTWQGRD